MSFLGVVSSRTLMERESSTSVSRHVAAGKIGNPCTQPTTSLGLNYRYVATSRRKRAIINVNQAKWENGEDEIYAR